MPRESINPAKEQQLERLLIDGVTKLDLLLNVEQIKNLLLFVNLVAKWNATHNLTAINDAEEVVIKHLLDSLSVHPYFDKQKYLTDQPLHIADIGCGAGLPSVPLAIVYPMAHFTLIDANFKKIAFLNEAKRQLNLQNINPIHGRVEQLSDKTFDLVTCRAFSSLSNFVNMTQHLLDTNGIWLALKGENPEAELAELKEMNSNLKIEVQAIDVPYLKAARHMVVIQP